MKKIVVGIILIGLVVYGLTVINDFYVDWKYEKVTQRLREKRESLASVDYFKTRPLLVFSTGGVGEMDRIWLCDLESNRSIESSWGKLEGIDLFKRNGIKEVSMDEKKMIEKMFEPKRVSVLVWDSNNNLVIVNIGDERNRINEIYKIDVNTQKKTLLYRSKMIFKKYEQSMGECATVVGWDVNNNNLITKTEYYYDSDSFLTNICVIKGGGGIKRKINLPNLGSKWVGVDNFKNYFNKILVTDLMGHKLVVDLKEGKVSKPASPDCDVEENQIRYRSLSAGKYLVVCQGKGVGFYNIDENKLSDFTKIDNKSLYSERWRSNDGKWLLFDVGQCVYLFDSEKEKMVNKICPGDFEGRPDVEWQFRGWVE